MIKLLVIDDEAGVCDVIARTFSYVGFTVFTAASADKARKILDKEKPTIVFLDVIIPDVDGWELLREIKKKYPGTIVIMITVLKDEQTKEEALKLGADEFITKPFSHNYLRDVVANKIQGVLDKGGYMKKPSILVVDDEKDFRETVNSFIKNRFECDLSEAREGAEAIDKVKALKPDIILLDIKMPGISGIDVIGEIKKLSPESRVLVISAWKSAEVVKEAIQKGASDFMGKPISLSVLGEKLKTNLISMGKLILKKP